ncbi:hypothetical protein LSAT2_021620 [Lamellibrachia satsuma]|nr:hypothetical protein LSAT2_021620 [Lamellibrachia satsuma]
MHPETHSERDKEGSTYILCEKTPQFLLVHVDVLNESLHQSHRARDITRSRATGSTAVWTAIRVGRLIAAEIPGGPRAGPALPDGSRYVLQLFTELTAKADKVH